MDPRVTALKESGQNLSRRFQKLLSFFQPSDGNKLTLKDILPLLQSATGHLPLPSSLPGDEGWDKIEKELASIRSQVDYMNGLAINLEQDEGLQDNKPAVDTVSEHKELSAVVSALANYWTDLNSDRKYKNEIHESLQNLGKKVSRFHLPPDLRIIRFVKNVGPSQRKYYEEKFERFSGEFYDLTKEVDCLKQKIEFGNFGKMGSPIFYPDASQGWQSWPPDESMTDFIYSLTEILMQTHPGLFEHPDEFMNAIDKMESSLGSIAGDLEKCAIWDTGGNYNRATLEDDPILKLLSQCKDQKTNLRLALEGHLATMEEDGTTPLDEQSYMRTYYHLDSQLSMAKSIMDQMPQLLGKALNTDSQLAATLLDEMEVLRGVWARANSRLLESRDYTNKRRENQYREDKSSNFLTKIPLPKLRSTQILKYAAWRLEFQKLMEKVHDSDAKLRCLRTSTAPHKQAARLIQHSMTYDRAMSKLDEVYFDEDSLIPLILKEITSLKVATDQSEECQVINKFEALLMQARRLAQTNDGKGNSSLVALPIILSMSSCLLPNSRKRYFTMRKEENHGNLPIQRQFEIFEKYLKDVSGLNRMDAHATTLKSVVSGRKEREIGSSKNGQGDKISRTAAQATEQYCTMGDYHPQGEQSENNGDDRGFKCSL